MNSAIPHQQPTPEPQPTVKSEPQSKKPLKQKFDDDEEKPKPKSYVTPRDELIGLVKEKYPNERLSMKVLERINTELSVRGTSWPAFLDVVRPELERGKLGNPVGFLVDAAKKFRAAATCPEAIKGEPVAAATPVEKCPLCHEPKGRGLRVVNNQIVPCECATPAFIQEHLKNEADRARKIAAPRDDAIATKPKAGEGGAA